MKKVLKKLATLGLAALAAVGIVACGRTTTATTYADCGMVCGITDDHVVTVEMQTGNEFTFEDKVSDWEIGDLCAMTMDGHGTKDVRDDSIRTTKYAGWVNPEEWVK